MGEVEGMAADVGDLPAGFFDDERAAARHGRGTRSIHEPDPDTAARYDALFGLYTESQARLAEVNHGLHAFELAARQPARGVTGAP